MGELVNSIYGYSVLLYIDNVLILSRGQNLYVADKFLSNIKFLCELMPLNLWKNIAIKSRLFQRLFRHDCGPAIPIEEYGCFLVFFRSDLFKVNYLTGRKSKEFIAGLKKRPLQLCISKMNGISGEIYFGEYVSNLNFNPINIYRRTRTGEWQVIYTFPKGEINHVHGIFEDRDQRCFYILSGDFDRGACIWRANIDFSQVFPLSRSGQKSRACWIHPSSGGFLFATDRQDGINYLCSGQILHSSLEIKELFPILGSSIYSVAYQNQKFAFSTAVEPNSQNLVNLNSLFSRKKSLGSLSENASIYYGDPSEGFKIIFSGPKDWLPFRLFQFGTMRFPAGIPVDDHLLHFYCVGITGADNTSYVIRI